jgi:two-component system NtrC family sensor kinase
MFHRRTGLAVKLAILLVASSTALLSLFGWMNLREQRRHSEELVLQSAEAVADVIGRSTHYQMLKNDREGLYQVINTLASEPGIRRIRIFNKEGSIKFSTEPAEVNRSVDKQAEACYACHAQQQPLTKLNRPDRARIFRDDAGRRVAAVINPIENRPECSNAACHAHPASQRVLGVIDANLSLDAVDQQTAAHQGHLITFTILSVVLASLLSIVFIWKVVYRPVQELIAGTHRLAEGDLDHRLPVRSDDELGDLADSFNKMTTELKAAHDENVTWARTLEARVESKSKQLESAHKLAAIGKLAATVAHEVNNPLFGILTYARLTLRELEQLKVSSDAVEHLRIIERESRRCGDIMRNLLTFARQAPSNRMPNDLNVLVERAVALVRHKMEMQGVELQENLAEDFPPVACDAGQIQQIVLVLLVNAVEAMPGGGTIRIETALDPDAGQAFIRVRDNGPGIPEELLTRIFEPFFTTKEHEQRTGLGLAVAQSISEQHGGDISVSSRPGEGTEFTVRLPAAALAGAASG